MSTTSTRRSTLGFGAAAAVASLTAPALLALQPNSI
jgi:hypothetical protein